MIWSCPICGRWLAATRSGARNHSRAPLRVAANRGLVGGLFEAAATAAEHHAEERRADAGQNKGRRFGVVLDGHVKDELARMAESLRGGEGLEADGVNMVVDVHPLSRRRGENLLEGGSPPPDGAFEVAAEGDVSRHSA